MRYLKNMILGIIMFVTGFMMFTRNITLSDPNNNGLLGDLFGALFGNSGAGALTGVSVVAVLVMCLFFVFKPNILTLVLAIGSVFALMFSIIAGLKISIADINGWELTIMFTFIFVGLAIVLHSYMKIMNNKDVTDYPAEYK